MQLQGLIAAAFSPFHPNGDLNLPVVAQQADWFASTGVSGVFVGGTTGESHSLTMDERIALANEWSRVSKGRLSVGVHVGSNCTRDAQRMAAAAEEGGAHAIAATAPFFFKPSNAADLVSYLAEVASASKLPFYFYDIASMTGVSLPTAEVVRQAIKKIPTFSGIKFTNYDLMTYLECSRIDSRLNCLYGHDEQLLAALTLGAGGAIGSTYNFAGPLYNRLRDAFKRNDLAAAREAQALSVQMIRTIIPFGFLRAGKVIMRKLGVDCGGVRSPLRNFTAEEEQKLLAALAECGAAFPKPLS